MSKNTFKIVLISSIGILVFIYIIIKLWLLFYGDVSATSVSIHEISVVNKNIEIKGSLKDSNLVIKGYEFEQQDDILYIKIRKGSPYPFYFKESSDIIINKAFENNISEIYLKGVYPDDIRKIWDKKVSNNNNLIEGWSCYWRNIEDFGT